MTLGDGVFGSLQQSPRFVLFDVTYVFNLYIDVIFFIAFFL